MAVLLSALVWAVTSSPLTRRLFGSSTPPPRPAPIVGALGPLTDQTRPTSGPATATTPATPTSPLSAAEAAAWHERHAADWRRDPFFTAAEEEALASPKVKTEPAKPPAPLPAYTVKTIMISGGDKVASVGGRLVSEGDTIGEERVVEIRPDVVVLERAGERRRIALPGGSVAIDDTGRSAARGR